MTDLQAPAVASASDPVLRRSGIGGSDAASILGLNPYSSRYAIACEKVYGVTERRTPEEQERLQLGHDLEPVVRRSFERKTGMVVRAAAPFMRHPAHPFIFANLDGVIVDGEALDEAGEPFFERWKDIVPGGLVGPGVFEGKTASGDAADPWGTRHDPRVPTSYWVQGQHYLAVTGLRWVGYGCLVNAQRLDVRFTLRDDAWIDGVLLPALVAFWADVEAGNVGAPEEPGDLEYLRGVVDPPALAWGQDVGELEDRVAALRKAKAPKEEIAAAEAELRRRVNAGTVELDDAETREVYRWADALALRGEAEASEARLKLRVCEMMGSASIGRLSTGELISWKTTSNGQRRLRAPFKPKGKR